MDTACGMEAQLLLEKTVKWTEEMYDWSPERREKYINAGDSNRIVYIEYNYHQIGKTEAWFKAISAKINDPLVVRREILLQRLRGSDTSPYPRDTIDAIIDMEHKPISDFFLQEYFKVQVYEELDKSIPYIVGIDCSSGTVGDNNAMTIINPYTLKQAAEFECSFVGETMYENCIKELVMKHIPRAVLCIERNNVGDGIIDHLLNSPIVANLYFDRNKNLMDEKMSSNESTESLLKMQAKSKTFYGVWTGTTSRETMFAILSTHVHEKKETFVAHNVIRDLSRLVKKSNGKIEAGAGFHDDSIMSYLIGLYVYYHGNNLELFGIVPGMGDGPLNEGLQREPEEDLRTLSVESLDLGVEVTQDLKAQQERERNTEDYEAMMRRAIQESQKQSQILTSKGFTDSVYANTPDYLVDSYSSDEGSIPLDFFDEINGF